jgi:hypothetical protein
LRQLQSLKEIWSLSGQVLESPLPLKVECLPLSEIVGRTPRQLRARREFWAQYVFQAPDHSASLSVLVDTVYEEKTVLDAVRANVLSVSFPGGIFAQLETDWLRIFQKILCGD